MKVYVVEEKELLPNMNGYGDDNVNVDGVVHILNEDHNGV